MNLLKKAWRAWNHQDAKDDLDRRRNEDFHRRSKKSIRAWDEEIRKLDETMKPKR